MKFSKAMWVCQVKTHILIHFTVLTPFKKCMRGVARLKRAIISTVQRLEAGGGRHQHNIGKGLKNADVTEEQLKTLPS